MDPGERRYWLAWQHFHLSRKVRNGHLLITRDFYLFVLIGLI